MFLLNYTCMVHMLSRGSLLHDLVQQFLQQLRHAMDYPRQTNDLQDIQRCDKISAARIMYGLVRRENLATTTQRESTPGIGRPSIHGNHDPWPWEYVASHCWTPLDEQPSRGIVVDWVNLGNVVFPSKWHCVAGTDALVESPSQLHRRVRHLLSSPRLP